MTPIIMIFLFVAVIIFFLFVAVLCVLGLFLFLQPVIKPEKIAQPYVLKTSLFTPAERSFLGCLDSVLSPEIRVFGKVRLADLFNVERTLDRSAWQSAFNKINSKHVDFILFRANDLCPLLAIELDDKTHAMEERQQRDVFLTEIFANSHLPLIRFKVQKFYRPEDIAQRLNEAMS
jgi:hypothetical protein